MTLYLFELRLLLRSRWLGLVAAVFALAALGVSALGLSTFRVLGLGAGAPATTALLDLGLLAPSAFALFGGSAALGADREGGFLAMLRAAGITGREIIVAKVGATASASALVLAAGYGASALVLAGNVPLDDLPSFIRMVVITLLASGVAAAVGVLVSAATRTRQEALVVSVAVWFALAVGLELVVLALAPIVRGGVPAVLLLLLLDPLECARALGLLLLGADAEVLGAFGTLLRGGMGALGAALALLIAMLAWGGGAALAAARLVDERDAL